MPVLEGIAIPDICRVLLEQERQGALQILRYGDLTPKMPAWIRGAEAVEIREHGLLYSDSPMAAYMRTHDPESWALCENEEIAGR